MRMLDLFCGRFGWSKAFAARGWECVGIDLVEPPEVPENFRWEHADVLGLTPSNLGDLVGDELDFICASPPCEQFSVHGMKHFHPNPPYPELGIRLFNHTRSLCEASGLPYVIENVRAAQKFVGNAVHHCGPFYLWGNAVPPLMPQNIKKGMDVGSSKLAKKMTKEQLREYRKQFPIMQKMSWDDKRKDLTAGFASIPPELSNCVAEYAERLIEMRQGVTA